MRKTCTVLLALLFAATTASRAQQDKWAVFGGYTIARASGYPNLFTTPGNGSGDVFAPFSLSGGGGSVTYSPWKYVGFTADFSITSRNHTIYTPNIFQTVHTQNYLFGPEFRYTIKTASGSQRVTLFAHQLFGVSHTTNKFTSFDASPIDCYSNGQTMRATCSANPFTLASGGGMDIRVDSHISIRPAQLDYWTQQLSATSFLGSGLAAQTDSGKLGVSGIQYKAGVLVRF